MDERGENRWTTEMLRETVKEILLETNTLFDDLIKNIGNDPAFAKLVEEVVFAAVPVPYRVSNPLIAKKAEETKF